MSGQLRTEDNETLFGEEFTRSVTELSCLTDSLSMNQFGLALFTKWQLTLFMEFFTKPVATHIAQCVFMVL